MRIEQTQQVQQVNRKKDYADNLVGSTQKMHEEGQRVKMQGPDFRV